MSAKSWPSTPGAPLLERQSAWACARMSSRLILWDGRLPLPGDDVVANQGGKHGTGITGDRSRQAIVSPVRHRHRRGDPVAEGQPGEAGRGGEEACPKDNRDGGVRQCALLGSLLARRRPRSAPHQSAFREALRQGIEERCRRRGGDLRSGVASDDALRAGKVDGSAGPAVTAPGPRSADLPTDGVDQPYPWPARRIRDRAYRKARGGSWPRPPLLSPLPTCPT